MKADATGGPPRSPDIDAPSDEVLLAAYVAGDPRSLDLLVRRHARRVYAICFRYFGNAADAEDAAQETFLAVVRRAGTFSGAAAFSTWLYRVATNACNDLARKRARRPRTVPFEPGSAEAAAGGQRGTDELFAAGELDADLEAALRALDPDQREAVVLHDVAGLGYAQIAARTGVAVGTVKSRVHRGHARLAAQLAAEREPTSPVIPPTNDSP